MMKLWLQEIGRMMIKWNMTVDLIQSSCMRFSKQGDPSTDLAGYSISL